MDHTGAAPEAPFAVEERPELAQGLDLDQDLGLDQGSGSAQGPEGPGVDQDQRLDEADEPAPDYPDPPRTGDPAVDEVIDAVARAVGGPLEEQLAVYDTAYRTLQDRLADVEG